MVRSVGVAAPTSPGFFMPSWPEGVKELDLRIFEFADLGALQKSATYFVPPAIWKVLKVYCHLRGCVASPIKIETCTGQAVMQTVWLVRSANKLP